MNQINRYLIPVIGTKGCLSTMLFLCLMITANMSLAQLTGTKNVPSVNYPTLKVAVDSLNLYGVGIGGVNIDIAAGFTETAPAGGYTLTASGTLSNPIVFQKSGAGTNPLVRAQSTGTATPASTTQLDGIFRLVGADWVTMDGIDLLDTNTLSLTMMEYGYGLYKASATNGCNNNTIKNCTVTLNRNNTNAGSTENVNGSCAIFGCNTLVNTPNIALTVTNVTGNNSNNKFYTNTLTNCNEGIVLRGYTDAVAPFSFYDENNDIGGSSSLTGNIIVNYGGGATPLSTASGIRVTNQNACNIAYNNVNNNNGSGISHVVEVKGIFANSPNAALVTVSNNTVSQNYGANSSFFTYQAIECNGGSLAASSVINMNNNTVANCVVNPMTNAGNTNAFVGVRATSTTALTINITGNIIRDNSMLNVGGFTGITYGGTNLNATVNITGNQIYNVTKTINNPAVSGGGQNVTGINCSAGNVTIANNQLHDFVTNLNTGSGPNTTLTTQTAGISLSSGTFQNSLLINGNEMYNFTVNTHTTSAPSNGTIFGILNTNTGTAIANYTISNNLFHDFTANNDNIGAGQMVAMMITDGGLNCNVFNNKIYNLTSAGVGLTTVGMRVISAINLNVYNNYIGQLSVTNATAASNAEQVIGINDIAGTTTQLVQNHNYYNNTVYLSGTSTGTNFGSSAIRTTYTAMTTTTGTNVTLRNNIFNNNTLSTGTGFAVAHRRSVNTGLTNYTSASNTNIFYAGAPSATHLLFYDGSAPGSLQTMATYKTYTGRESASASENTTFLNTVTGALSTYLHVDPTVGSAAESGGTSIALVNLDYDGHIRFGSAGYPGGSAGFPTGGTNPDIGADEFGGIVADAAAPTIQSGVILSTCNNGDRLISGVIITDATGVPISGGLVPRIYYKRNTGGTFASSPGVLNTGSATNGTWDFTVLAASMPGLTIGDSVMYYFIAQDNIGNISSNPAGAVATDVNTVSTHPTSAILDGAGAKYKVLISLSGSYDVGPGSPFATSITAAVAIYNSACLSGAVIFNLTATTYLSETFPITINSNPFASATNTLTIKPKTGNVSISGGPAATSIFQLNAADYIIIEGSVSPITNTVCPLSLSTRNMTLNITNTGATQISVVYLNNIGTDGATNNIVRNCILIGNSNVTTTAGIATGPSSGVGTGGNFGMNNNNNIFENDSITRTQNGIVSNGFSALIKNQNNIYRLNQINSPGSAVPASNNCIGRVGIYISFENNAQIVGNAIKNITGQASGTDVFGIALGSTNSIQLSSTGSNEVTNAFINKNVIDSITTSSTLGAHSAIGIALSNAPSGTASTGTNVITNNMISRVAANANSSDFTCGIFAGNQIGSTLQVYNNTVSMNSTFFKTSFNATAALYVLGSGIIPALDIRNNIMMVTGSVGFGNNYVVGFQAPGLKGNYGNLISDNNDLFVLNGGGPIAAIGETGAINGPTGIFTTLTNWKTETGKDVNSLNVQAITNSFSDLHLVTNSPNNVTLNGTAQVLGSIIDDIDCELRIGAGSPDVGADEFSIPPVDIAFDAIYPTANTTCHSVSEPIIVSVRNTGSTTIDLSVTPITVNVSVTGTITDPTPTGTLSAGTIAPNATVDITCTPVINTTANGSYVFTTTVTPIVGEFSTANNNNTTSIIINNTPVSVVASSLFANICAGQSTTLSAAPVNGTLPYAYLWSSGSTNISTPVSPSASSTYTVTVTDACGITATGTASVTLNDPQVNGTLPNTRCGTGTTTLGATPSAGASINWYATPSSLPALLIGSNSFPTPIISSTTTYYAAAAQGSGPFPLGLVNNSSANGSFSAAGVGTNPLFIPTTWVTANRAGSITALTLYPNAAGTIKLYRWNILGASSVKVDSSALITFTNAQIGTAVRVNVNMAIPSGTWAIGLDAVAPSTGNTVSFGRMNPLSGGLTYPFSTSEGSLVMTGSSLVQNLVTTSGLYNFLFNVEFTTYCESARVAVVATVTPPDPLTLTPNQNLCLGNIQMLNVTSTNTNYDSYIWSPSTNLYTDPAATIAYSGGNEDTLYVKSAVAGSTTYTVNASNSSSGCATTANCLVTYNPTVTGLTTTNVGLCGNGTVTLSLVPLTGYAANGVTWQNSPDSINWTTFNIGTGTVTSPNISITTYFRALLISTNNNGDTCAAQGLKVNVYNPSSPVATNNQRCGTGTVSLSASVGSGATATWYASPTSQPPIGTGSPFTTPSISSTTTYYVSASQGSSNYPVGVPTASSAYGTVFTFNGVSGVVTPDKPLWITVNKPGTLKSVIVYPVGPGALTINLRLRGSAADIFVAGPFNILASDSGKAIELPVNMAINTPGIYQITNIGVGCAIMSTYNGAAGAYPFSTADGSFLIVGSANNSTSVSAPTSGYNAMFNVLYNTACESARMPVVATVNAPLPLTLSTVQDTACGGSAVPISVTSTLSNFTSYIWAPAAGLYTDVLLANPYNGSDTTWTTIYALPIATTQYTLTASNINTLCSSNLLINIVPINILPSVVTNVTATDVCGGGNTTLSITGVTNPTIAKYKWESSPDSSIWNVIPLAIGSTYFASPLNSTTYFRCGVYCKGSLIGYSPAVKVFVYDPQVIAFANGTHCGPASVTLGATPSLGASIEWYNGPTGGTPVGYGNSYSTPVINSNTTYYASATQGSYNESAGEPVLVFGGGTSPVPNRGLVFNTAKPIFLNSCQLAEFSGGSGNVDIALQDNAGIEIASSGPVSFSGVGTIPLNMSVPTGSGFRLVIKSCNVSFMILKTGGLVFPYNSQSGAMSITSSITNGITTTSSYYFFYNINFTASCISPRIGVTASITPAPPASVNVSQNNICPGTSVTLTAISPNDPNYVYTWQPGSIPGPIDVVSPLGTSTYTVTGIDTSSTVNNGCTAVINTTISVNAGVPPFYVSPPVIGLCAGTSTALLAVSPLIAGNDTIGKDTLNANQPNNYPAPYGAFRESAKHQILVLASELAASGMANGSEITSLAFSVQFVGSAGIHNNFIIKMAHTNQSSLTGWTGVGFSPVFGPVNYQPVLGSNVHLFSTPFIWDGVSNIIVETCFSNDPTNAGVFNTANAVTNRSVTAGNTVIYANLDNLDICPFQPSFGLSNTRPNIIFTYTKTLSYAWTPATGLNLTTGLSVTATPASTTVYTVTATSLGGCTQTSTSNVLISAVPKPYLFPGDTMLCTGDFLIAAARDSGAYSLGWPVGTLFDFGIGVGTDSTYLVNGPGAFNVTVILPPSYSSCSAVTGISGISFSESPQIIVSTDSVKCFGSNTGYVSVQEFNGTAPFRYKYYNSLGNVVRNVVTNLTEDTLFNAAAGQYCVVVTDKVGGTYPPPSCHSDSICAEVFQPDLLVITGTTTNLSCRGIATGAINITVTGGTTPYTYLWNNGSTNQNRTGLSAGTYKVTVTDANGCTKAKQYTVSQPSSNLILNTSKTNVRCFGLNGGVATVSPAGGIGPYSFSWNTFPVQTTASITGLASGSYTCTVTDANGCIKNAIINITQPADMIVFQTQTNVTTNGGNDGTATVSVSGGTPGYTYKWTTTPVKTTSSVTGLSAGTYKCTITDTRSCSKKVTFVITQPGAKIMENHMTGYDWNVKEYPNPSTGMVLLSFMNEKEEQFVISLTDYLGRKVYEKESIANSGMNEIMYDFSNLVKGVYFIQIKSAEKSKTIRIVLQ